MNTYSSPYITVFVALFSHSIQQGAPDKGEAHPPAPLLGNAHPGLQFNLIF